MIEYRTSDLNIEDIKGLLQKFIDESVFESDVSIEGINGIVSNDNFLKIVAYDDVPVGVFIGVKYKHPIFRTPLVSDDLLMFVDKSHRGSMIACRFVKKYEKWAKDSGVRYVRLGNSTGSGDIEKTGKFYESLGFKKVGFNTMKEV